MIKLRTILLEMINWTPIRITRTLKQHGLFDANSIHVESNRIVIQVDVTRDPKTKVLSVNKAKTRKLADDILKVLPFEEVKPTGYGGIQMVPRRE